MATISTRTYLNLFLLLVLVLAEFDSDAKFKVRIIRTKPKPSGQTFRITVLPNIYKDQGRSLPKFGEWDVNNPASAEGFTVIFSKARDEKKSTNASTNGQNSQRNDNPQRQPGDHLDSSIPKKWWCCF